MRWSWKIGRIAGIELFIHATFLLLIPFIVVSDLRQQASFFEILQNLFLVAVVFGIVVLHELGHALMARRYGIPTRNIILLPIGGVAQLERMPEKPRQEFWVAVAGPLVNIFLAAIILVILMLSGQFQAIAETDSFQDSFLWILFIINILLAIFNLLPAFPMDGGRVLRALLATKLPFVQATRWAVNVARVMAVLFAIYGFYGDFFLVLIAAFVWVAGNRELQTVIYREMYEKNNDIINGDLNNLPGHISDDNLPPEPEKD